MLEKQTNSSLCWASSAFSASGFSPNCAIDVGSELDAVEARLGDVGDAGHIVVPPRHRVAGEAEGTGRRAGRERSER